MDRVVELRELDRRLDRLRDEQDEVMELKNRHEDYFRRYNRKDQLVIADELGAKWLVLEEKIEVIEGEIRRIKMLIF
jgi:hypothetical protein